MREVSLLAEGHHDAIDLLLSVGNGNAKVNSPRLKFGSGSLLQELTDISDMVHDKAKIESGELVFDYFRFVVKEGLQSRPHEQVKAATGLRDCVRKDRKGDYEISKTRGC